LQAGTAFDLEVTIEVDPGVAEVIGVALAQKGDVHQRNGDDLVREPKVVAQPDRLVFGNKVSQLVVIGGDTGPSHMGRGREKMGK
jgi:hypothetical protein